MYDHAAEPVRGLDTRREWSFKSRRDGGSEMNANTGHRVVCGVIDDLLAKTARRKVEITHVAVCSFWHSLLGVDSKGKPTTAVLGWADTRSRDYSAILKKRFNEREVHNRTGAHFHSSFWPAKLLWLRRQRGEAFDRTAKWLGLAEYLALKLFGDGVTSISMASATGIFDQRKCDWDSELLKYLRVRRSQLPDLARRGPAFRIDPKYARRWPQLANAQWLPAIGDGAADHIGSAGIGKSRASLMVGTSAAMRIAYAGEPPAEVPSGLWSYRIDDQRVIVGGAFSDGGNLYEKFKRELNIRNGEDDVAGRAPGVGGVLVLPFFFGERSTGYRETIRGAIVGSNAEIDKIDLLRAAMEGVAYRIAAVFDRLKHIGRISTIVASGGALRDSRVWPQIIADVLGRDLVLTDTKESASRGAVLLALESVGKIESIDEFSSREGTHLAFSKACHAVYKRARTRHEAAISKAHGDQT